jgi:hypothetical protein
MPLTVSKHLNCAAIWLDIRNWTGIDAGSGFWTSFEGNSIPQKTINYGIIVSNRWE